MKKASSVTIEEFTSTDPITVTPKTKVEEVIALFREHGFRHIPVVEAKKPVGIISDRDVLFPRPLGVSASLTAREIMTRNPYCVQLDATLEDVSFTLSSRKFGSALVLDREGNLRGIFTSTDALNALVELLREQN